MILTRLIIYKSNSTFKELEELSSIVDSKEIKNNGKIIVKCNTECDYKELRKKIRDILNVDDSKIMCIYKEMI